MRTAIAVLFTFTMLAFAEDNPNTQIKRVVSVSWNLQTGKLAWVVQTGTEGKDGFVASSEEHYEISPTDAVMTGQGEERRFTAEEGSWLKNLLHVLTVYCVESTIWWYRGESAPTPDPKSAPSQSDPPKGKPIQDPDTGPHKILDKMPMLIVRPLTLASGFPGTDSSGRDR